MNKGGFRLETTKNHYLEFAADVELSCSLK